MGFMSPAGQGMLMLKAHSTAAKTAALHIPSSCAQDRPALQGNSQLHELNGPSISWAPGQGLAAAFCRGPCRRMGLTTPNNA